MCVHVCVYICCGCVSLIYFLSKATTARADGWLGEVEAAVPVESVRAGTHQLRDTLEA